MTRDQEAVEGVRGGGGAGVRVPETGGARSG